MAGSRLESLRISLLGTFRVTYEGSDVLFPTRKVESLLACLALNPEKRLSRERLSGWLWPDLDDERARRNLSTAIWRLSRALEPTGLHLRANRDSVQLLLGESEVDVRNFVRAVEKANVEEGDLRLSALQVAERLYSGDLLEGFPDEWCEDERRSLRQLYCDLVRKLVHALRDRGDHGGLQPYLRKLLRMDPYDENAHRDFMLAQYLSGNRATALAHYGQVKSLLMEDLGVPPAAETTDLYEYIRSQDLAGLARPMTRGEPGLLNSDALRLPQIPTIGRENELVEILESLERTKHGVGGATVVYGGPGIGKTKLAETVIVEARLRGLEVLDAGCPDSISPAPYQVLIQAIWPRVAEGLLPTSPWFAVIKAIADAMSMERAGQTSMSSLVGADSIVLNQCILAALGESSHGNPTLLVLEDLHRVDAATEAFLLTLLPRLARMPLHVLVTLREDEGKGKQLVTSLSSNGARPVLLGPLDREEVRRLLAAALGADKVEGGLSAFVLDRSGGVPLFILEFLKVLKAEGCIRRNDRSFALDRVRVRTLSSSLPSGLAEVIHQRVSLLDTRAKELLSAAAVLGLDASYEHLEALVGVPEDEFIECAERIVELRLLEETDRGLRFTHEAIRQAVGSMISRPRLRRLHARAAAVIERTMPGSNAELAWHYAGAGEMAKAVANFEIAGDKARFVHGNEDAVQFYSSALRSLESLDQADPKVLRTKVSLLLKRQDSLDLVGDRTKQVRDIEVLASIARKLVDYSLQAHAALLRCQVLTRMSKHREALEAAEEAGTLFALTQDKLGAARAVEVKGLVQISLRNRRKAESCFKRAINLFQESGDRPGEARALVHLGTVVAFGGKTLRAVAYLDQAERALRGLPDQRSLAVALLQKGVLYRYLGKSAESERFLLDGIAAMNQIGDRIGEARGLSQLACTYAAMGRLRESLRSALRALRLARDTEDVRAQIMFWNNIAYYVYRCLGAWGRAERSVLSALDMVARSGQFENASIYYDTMAAILIDKGEPERALDWLKRGRLLSRAQEEQSGFVHTDMAFHTAAAYLAQRKPEKAHPLIQRAIDRWRQGGDLALLAHGVGLLGSLRLQIGDMQGALVCARDLERLLRRIDGVEQIQKLFWQQYRIFRQVGANAAARKALRKALHTVLEQAATLRGRLRRRFLASVKVNREIVAEAMRLRLISEAQPIRRVGLEGHLYSNELGADFGRRVRIAERRQNLLALLRAGPVRQSIMADRLHVSTRTLRNDLAALREQGLLVDRSPPQRVQPQETGP